MQGSLIEQLKIEGVGDDRISDVIDSGYFLKAWMTLPGNPPNITVSDMLYGNKAQSSSFETKKFIAYVKGNSSFERAPPFRRIKVKCLADIQSALSEYPRDRYIKEGSLTFRGQPREHSIMRRLPNPFRGNDEGRELSIMPGIYRQKQSFYSCAVKHVESRSFELFAHQFEGSRASADIHFSYDLMRTEQHYATHTAGLDLTFDVTSAIFFATHEFKWGDDGLAFYHKVTRGSHRGVIYLFRFGSPSVRQSEYLIKDFDFFQKHRPERILRQSCALPLFSDYDRNIAITEIDCVLELHEDYDASDVPTPEFMFPSVEKDSFYRKLLELKDLHPDFLDKVVEYRWARSL